MTQFYMECLRLLGVNMIKYMQSVDSKEKKLNTQDNMIEIKNETKKKDF